MAMFGYVLGDTYRDPENRALAPQYVQIQRSADYQQSL